MFDYKSKAKSYKVELSDVKERLHALEKVESEYKSFKKEVSVKVTAYEKLDEDVFRLKAEI